MRNDVVSLFAKKVFINIIWIKLFTCLIKRIIRTNFYSLPPENLIISCFVCNVDFGGSVTAREERGEGGAWRSKGPRTDIYVIWLLIPHHQRDNIKENIFVMTWEGVVVVGDYKFVIFVSVTI